MADHKKRRRWKIAGQVLTAVFLLLVGWLIAARLKAIQWSRVGEALGEYEPATLAKAGMLVVVSYLLYGGFELVARAYTRHRLPRWEVGAIAFVSYAFNLNLSAWIGGIGFRFRLYSRRGLHAGLITRILGMSVMTNWLGYVCLAGLVFALRMLPLPAHWDVGTTALQYIGFALLGVGFLYLGLSAWSPRRSFEIRDIEIPLPPPQMATTQLVLSVANWLTIAAVVFVLLQGHIAFEMVLATVLLASIAGVVAHIPAGLGVIEAVFLAVLGDRIPETDLIAALLAYRAVYYLAPLLLATVVYLSLEARAKRRRPPAPARAST